MVGMPRAAVKLPSLPLLQSFRPLPFGKNPCESGNHGGQRVGYNEGMPGRMVREALRLLKHEWRPV